MPYTNRRILYFTLLGSHSVFDEYAAANPMSHFAKLLRLRDTLANIQSLQYISVVFYLLQNISY